MAKTRYAVVFGLIGILILFTPPLQGDELPPAQPYKYVKTQGRQLLVAVDMQGNYEPFFIKGVGYLPTPIGRAQTWGWPQGYPRPTNMFDDDAILDRDFPLLTALNANTIRLWRGENMKLADGSHNPQYPDYLTEKLLAKASAAGLKVIAGFWMDHPGDFVIENGERVYRPLVDYTNETVRQTLLDRFAEYVTTFKHRPEILFWAIGNEENVFMDPSDTEQACAFYSLVNEMGQKVREIEGQEYYHPVAIVAGDMPPVGEPEYCTTDTDLEYIDIWGSNIYWGSSFYAYFYDYSQKSSKPFWVSEYGVDAWNTTDFYDPAQGYVSEELQSAWNELLWDEIEANRDITIGGTIMAYSDDWDNWFPFRCEDEETNPERCPVQGGEAYLLNTGPVHFVWEERPLADNYQLCVASYNGNDHQSQNIFSCTDYLEPPEFVEVTIPPTVTDGNTVWDVNEVYVFLKITINADVLNEVYYYHRSETRSDVNNPPTVMLRPFGSKHNYWGTSPLDSDNDGIVDFYPPSPDNYWNQEWWGIVAKERSVVNPYGADDVYPRLSYTMLQTKFDESISQKLPSYLVYPADQSLISSHELTFAWSLGKGVDVYRLTVGTSPGGSDLFTQDYIANEPIVLNAVIPLTGQKVYVSLLSWIDGAWVARDPDGYVFDTIVDAVAPSIVESAPDGVLPPETSQVSLSVVTDEPAECRYDTRAGMAYNSMHVFAQTQGIDHTQEVPWIRNGERYIYYVKCQDNNGNTMPSDEVIDFSIAIANKITPGRITVASGQEANMTFSVFLEPAGSMMYMYCPAGLTIGLNENPNICNRWMMLALPGNTDTLMTFRVTNTTAGIKKAVPNFYIFKQSMPNYAIGVSGEITVLPAPVPIPSPSPMPTSAPYPSASPIPSPSPS